MTDPKPLRTLCASIGVALALGAAACLLPENSYQRWQLVDGTVEEPLRWGYERIHFDARPIDIAIIGSSKTMLGLSASRIEEQLSSEGKPVHVVNFSAPVEGRNVGWAVLDELFKSKSPKLIVIGITREPFPYGHPAFKYVAPAHAIVYPPAPLLHNYFYDLANLPSRKLKLFSASLAPNLFGLRDRFDPEIYARTRSDFSSGSWVSEGKLIDMDREVTPAALLAQARHPATSKSKLVTRALAWCCNEGDEHVYVAEIARLAQAHGAKLLFVLLPEFNDRSEIRERDFLERYGKIVDMSDLADQDKLYQSSGHLNHAGALIASDRIANEVRRSSP
jgi:hypothetical protein